MRSVRSCVQAGGCWLGIRRVSCEQRSHFVETPTGQMHEVVEVVLNHTWDQLALPILRMVYRLHHTHVVFVSVAAVATRAWPSLDLGALQECRA